MPSVPLLPNPHGRPPVLRHYVQSGLHLFDRSSMAKQNLSHRANVINNGSPSRIRIVRRISLGMTTRPKSSMRRTIPVAFIYQIPPAVAFCRQRVVSAKSGCLCKNLRKDFAGRVVRSGARAPCGRRLFCFDMRDTRRASALTEALHGEKSAAVPLGRQHGSSRITGGTWPLGAGLSCRTDW